MKAFSATFLRTSNDILRPNEALLCCTKIGSAFWDEGHTSAFPRTIHSGSTHKHKLGKRLSKQLQWSTSLTVVWSLRCGLMLHSANIVHVLVPSIQDFKAGATPTFAMLLFLSFVFIFFSVFILVFSSFEIICKCTTQWHQFSSPSGSQQPVRLLYQLIASHFIENWIHKWDWNKPQIKAKYITYQWAASGNFSSLTLHFCWLAVTFTTRNFYLQEMKSIWAPVQFFMLKWWIRKFLLNVSCNELSLQSCDAFSYLCGRHLLQKGCTAEHLVLVKFWRKFFCCWKQSPQKRFELIEGMSALRKRWHSTGNCFGK